MSARVLVVDDLLPNIKLLETRLSAEYFDVIAAMNGPDALSLCEQNACDIVLLDAMMPGMDGFEVCRRLKSSPSTAHIPVVMVTALDQPSDRLKGLDAGADDFLTKPVDDTALLARVRSLVRLKSLTDELRARIIASPTYGASDDPLAAAAAETGHNAEVLIVDDRASSCERMAEALAPFQRVDVEADPQLALVRAAEKGYDVVLVSLDLKSFDGLRLCSQLRALERTRNSAILMVAEADSKVKLLRGLDLGVHDFLVRPVDRNELVARVRTQVRRKRFADRLRDSVQANMEFAVTDPLTGLHNRRYLDTHLGGLFEEASLRAQQLSLLVLDIDRFKAINDAYGHAAGDQVLKEFSARIKANARAIDVVARVGGEEIVVVVPEIPLEGAQAVAERIRLAIEADAFVVQGMRRIAVTVSIGVAARRAGDMSVEEILKRADEALYLAKRGGRNRVVAPAA